MARQVMKIAGSVSQHWSRRWGILLSLVLAAAAGAVYVQTVLAVHDTGRFELDGNTASGGTDDWDRVCFQVTGNAGCGASSGTTGANPAGVTPTTGAVAVTWTGDCLQGSGGFGCNNVNATIFTGGGSKDPQNIDQWAWKDGAGGLPDKDNLVHAFAARYSATPDAQHCPALQPDGTTAATCEVIYFGSDRFDNSGDAQQGFWFLQNAIGLGTNAVGGGTGFTGVHRNGDLLVISDFSNGGSTSTITVLKWDTTCTATDNSKNPPPQPCADANLRRLATSTNALCGGASGDPYCGIVNSTAIPTSWPTDYTDKSGNTSYLNGELFEAGINLTNLGLGNECFSSVVSETRSSTSTTATLKDFVLGSFAQCGASLTTTPSATTVTPGTAVTDTAVVQGVGTANPPTPTGNVSFFWCAPSELTPANTGICVAPNGTALTPVALANAAPPAGKASATSASISPTVPGQYCFRASWPGDTNYTGGPFSDNASTECFTVQTIGTTTVTTPASDSSGTAIPNPLTTGVALGTGIFDKAVVTASASGGGPVTGSVAFFACNPSQVTGGAGSEVCASGAGSQVGNAITLTAVPNSNPPAGSAVSSPALTLSTAGVWCFRASYTPSGSVYTSSADVGSHSECVKVNPAATTTVTTPQSGNPPTTISGPLTLSATPLSVFDKAVVTGNAAGGPPTGTVSFFICTPTDLAGQQAGSEACASGGTQIGSAVTLAAIAGTNTSQATSTPAYTPTVVGTFCFRGVYTSNTVNYLGSSDASHTECFAVQDATGITSAQNWLPNDSATLTSAGGTALNGTLSFTLYSSSNCTTGVLYGPESFTLTAAASPATRATTNNTTKVSASTTVYWGVTFTSSDSKVIGKTTCKEQTQLILSNDNGNP